MRWIRHLIDELRPSPPAGAVAEPPADEIAQLRAAVAQNPRDADALFALGAALQSALKPAEAANAFSAALEMRPDDAAIRNELGAVLNAMGRHEEALAELEQARRLAPDMAEIYANLGGTYHNLGRLELAIENALRARDMLPGHPYIHSGLLLMLNYSARHTPQEIFAEHKRFGERMVQPVAPPPVNTAWPRKLRIGFMSPDFRSHVVAVATLPVIARLDRTRFEVFCYYTFPRADEMTARYRSLADGWCDCAALSDRQVAERIRADRIDILVDLAGHTAHSRLPVLALRPAPVLATAQGYPNTTGLHAVDYRITDAKADPPGEADRLHVERLERLPRTFMCYRPGPGFETVSPLPAATTGRITFGCFNNYQKLTDEFFATAARVLLAVPGSRLFLKAKQLAVREARARVEAAFAQAGIGPERLQLQGWTPSVEAHMAAYEQVDIALDTFPYNGTTTTCEALWMGVPVVALLGDRHAARVGWSLLETVGLPELVGRDADEYVRIAAELAANVERLASLRAGMRERMRASALMDEVGFVRDLERAYTAMWERKLAELGAPRLEAGSIAPLLTQAHSLRASGALEDARRICARVLREQPAHPEALQLAWDVSHQLGDDVAALDWLGRALAEQPEAAQLHYMLGRTLQDLGRDEEAIVAYRKARELDPSHAKAANNLGALYESRKALEQALACYADAARADPALASAHYNLGNVRKQLGRHAEAEADFRRALALEPRNAAWRSNLGETLVVQWKLDEAVAAHRAALELEPDNLEAHFGLANALLSLGRSEEAEAAFLAGRARESTLAHSNLLLCRHYHRGDDGAAMFEEHLEWARRHAAELPRMVARADIDRSPERRLNVGYISPDFRRHAVAWAIEPVFAAHDRAALRVFFYSNVASPDAVTGRFRTLCDEWRDVSRLSSEEIARQVRADRIDILVDLAGHTGGGRPLVLARKPAPIQVSWQGYPNTTGLGDVDYRIADEHADPEGMTDAFYTEKLVRLPTGFFCYAPPPDAPAVAETPAVRAGEVTFGCFNNLAKVTPQVIALWCELLKRLPQARMAIKAPSLSADSAHGYVLALFARGGIDAERIRLLRPDDDHAAHMARYGEIDIALDPFPYHGTATTCEALWMGVPVVTLAGRTHVSRVGVSILRRVGLEELVAQSNEDYIERAAALAADLPRLRALRGSLRERMRGSSLVNGAQFARALEAAYRTMWRTWCSQGSFTASGRSAERDCLRLHIGGVERKDGWKILNIQPGPHVDFVGDCTRLDRFADGSVEEVYASHVLEHLSYHRELQQALSEIHRVLRPGGVARISVPDFEAICRLFADPRMDAQSRFELMRMAFGGQVDAHDFHKVGLTHEFLSEFLYRAGFTRVERVKGFALFADASASQVAGVPLSLNVVAFK